MILAVATILGGISAVIHLFFEKRQKTILNNSLGMDEASNSKVKSLDMEKDNITDIRTGVIESFKESLLINGERVNLKDIQSYKVEYIDREIDYGHILFHLLSGVSRGVIAFGDLSTEFLKDKKRFILYNILLIIVLLILKIAVTDLNYELLKNIFSVALTIHSWSFIFFIIFSMGILCFMVLINILFYLLDYFFVKYEEINFIELVTLKKIYRLWIDHKKDHNNFNKVYRSLKETIFNNNSNRVIIVLSYNNNVSIKNKT